MYLIFASFIVILFLYNIRGIAWYLKKIIYLHREEKKQKEEIKKSVEVMLSYLNSIKKEFLEQLNEDKSKDLKD